MNCATLRIVNPSLSFSSSSSSSSSSSFVVRRKCQHVPKSDLVSIDWKKAQRRTSSFKCTHTSDDFPNQNQAISCSSAIETPLGTASCQQVSHKIGRLASEFKSLKEPIDRVKRLLHYAAILPPLEESARVPENRVTGCTTQVWLDARMDKNGKIRFQADSDSEITKGFCSCLIWMLDGADPEEVVGVRTEELAEMNVGLHGKAQSRVNTWHNVLISMQKRTEALVAKREGKSESQHPHLQPFQSLIVTAKNGIVCI